ncbi:MAG: LytR family transcriptional regulator [Blastococcus sp.]|jgi:hypothetical protein|nr:LytR family transcriptional regulator [Blastococcus sp.]
MAAADAGTPDAGGSMSRSKLPLPPVPVASRASVPAGARTPAAPRTSAAPFRAVPSPDLQDDLGTDRALSPARVPAGAAPARPRSSRESALVTSGPSAAGAFRSSAPAPRLPRQTTPAGAPSAAYGDWTKPSHDELDAEADAGALRVRPARDRRPSMDTFGDAPAAVSGPESGPVLGGRAALRAERQAADVARRKAAKRNGTPIPDALEDDEDEPGRPRRVVKGLLAMTVVALGVLGVYSFVSPETKDAASQTTAEDSVPDTVTNALPKLPTAPVEAEPVVVAPVKAPVTVLNATDINGLAAKVATTLNGGGWETPGVGAYTAGDVAASTVFFTEGDETQRQAALQLVDAYPQLKGPTPRFFELPADVTAPGLVVVLTGDWQP